MLGACNHWRSVLKFHILQTYCVREKKKREADVTCIQQEESE